MTLEQIADLLEFAPREDGHIRLSDRTARNIIATLRRHTKNRQPRGQAIEHR